MNQGIRKQCLPLFSKMYKQKYLKHNSDVDQGVFKAVADDPFLFYKRTYFKPSIQKKIMNKDNQSDILVFQQDPISNKDSETLIQGKNSLIVHGAYLIKDLDNALNSRDHLKKIPGPKFDFVDAVKKKLPIIRSEAALSVVHFLHGVPLGLGQYFSFIRNIHPFNNMFEKYGDIVGMKVPIGEDIVILRNPEHFDIVLRSELEVIEQSCISESLKAYAQDKFKSAGSHSLKLSSSSDHSLENPDFLSSFKTSEELNIIPNALIRRIEELNETKNRAPDFYFELCKWGLSWQQSLMFKPDNFLFLDRHQLKFDSQEAKMLSAFTEASKALRNCETGFHLWRIFNTPNWAKFSTSCNHLTGFFTKQIDKARTDLLEQKNLTTEDSSLEPRYRNIIEYLMTEKNANVDDLLRSLLEITLIGVNVMAFSMGFLLYHLSKAPRIQTKLHEEIKGLVKDKSVNLNFEDIDKLVYVKACVKEAVRLQLAIPFSIHKLNKDILISHYLIPKKTYIMLAKENACLNKDNFEEPDRFLPERWTTSTAQNLIDPLKFQQYGNGICSSIVKSFAEKEMCLLTAKIIRKYWIFCSHDDITADGKILASPTHPFRFLFDQRLN